MAKTILEEALADVKVLKESAIENAKNVLVEAMSPKIREFVESQLGESPDEATLPMYEKHEEPDGDESGDVMDALGLDDEEGEEEGDKDVETEAFSLSEEAESEKEEEKEEKEEDEVEESFQPLGEAEEMKEEVEEEVVNITNEDLKAALSEVLGSLKTEATVSKGFKDVEDVNAGATGLADKKSGESHWKDAKAPKAQNWTVAEAKAYVTAVVKENRALAKENQDYKKAYNIVRTKLQEVNLFNSKLLYTQRLLGTSNLKKEQRLGVIEAFDRASNMREVELVYKSLSESFKIAGVMVESKKTLTSKARASRLSTPSSSVLKESLIKESKQSESKNDFASRMQELAGIVD